MPAEGATSKNIKIRQKVSKMFSTLFVIFRTGQKSSKIVKKCQIYLRHFSLIFSRHQFSGPFWGALNVPESYFLGNFRDFLGNSTSEKCFWTLENGHSIRHQSMPPLSAGRIVCSLSFSFSWNEEGLGLSDFWSGSNLAPRVRRQSRYV